MDRQGHRLDTEARGIPAVSGTRVLVTQPWTTSGAKVRRERQARLARLQAAGLDGTEWHIAASMVPKANPRKRMTTNKVKTYIDPNVVKRQAAQSDSIWSHHDYTQG